MGLYNKRYDDLPEITQRIVIISDSIKAINQAVLKSTGFTDVYCVFGSEYGEQRILINKESNDPDLRNLVHNINDRLMRSKLKELVSELTKIKEILDETGL